MNIFDPPPNVIGAVDQMSETAKSDFSKLISNYLQFCQATEKEDLSQAIIMHARIQALIEGMDKERLFILTAFMLNEILDTWIERHGSLDGIIAALNDGTFADNRQGNTLPPDPFREGT